MSLQQLRPDYIEIGLLTHEEETLMTCPKLFGPATISFL